MLSKKNILLINPNCSDVNINRDMAGGLGYSAGKGVVLPPIDLIILERRLTKVGHKVYFVDALAQRFNLYKVKEFINKKKIDIVIGLLSLPNMDDDINFFSQIKRDDLKIIIKTGINYKEILEKIIRESGADMVIYGEPELDIDKIIVSKERIYNAGRIKNINKVPIANRKLLKNKLYKYILLPGVVTTMQTSRGCPFECGRYCPYPLVQGKIWRHMSVDRVIDEIESIYNLGIKNILFRDATFSLDKTRTIEICRAIVTKNIKLNWWCETRANVVDYEILEWMKKAGCIGINMGVESLDRDLIMSEGKPGVNVDMVKRVRDWGKKLGIKFHFLMIIGLPSDNVESLYHTYNCLKDIRPETIGFSVITPYPGTQLFDEARKNRMIKKFDWNEFDGGNCIMKTKNMSRFEIGLAKLLLMETSFLLKRPKFISFLPLLLVDVFFKVWIWLK